MKNNQNQDHNTHQYEQSDYTRLLKELRSHYIKAIKTCPGGEEGIGAILSSLHKMSPRGEEGKCIVAGFVHEVVLGVLGHQQCKTKYQIRLKASGFIIALPSKGKQSDNTLNSKI